VANLRDEVEYEFQLVYKNIVEIEYRGIKVTKLLDKIEYEF
jgi:hypothetical protein